MAELKRFSAQQIDVFHLALPKKLSGVRLCRPMCGRPGPSACSINSISGSVQSRGAAPNLDDTAPEAHSASHIRRQRRIAASRPFRQSYSTSSSAKSSNQRIARLAFSRSEITIEPGLCVMQNDGRARSTASCAVTPQAQNTGISSGRICGGFPLNNGLSRSLIPIS